jgi:hypothetical protein
VSRIEGIIDGQIGQLAAFPGVEGSVKLRLHGGAPVAKLVQNVVAV